MKEVPKSKRIHYLENLRGASILILVLFFHAAVPFTKKIANYLDFYLISPSHLFYDFMVIICDTFLMAMLFFLAGFFALPSLIKRGAWRYIRDKFFHIFIPFILGCFLLNPFPNYLRAQLEGNVMGGYLEYWKSEYLGHIFYQFVHGKASVYLWFLALLFFFFVALAILFAIHQRPFKEVHEPRSPRRRYLLLVVLFGMLGFGLVSMLTPDFGRWYTVGLFWTFQATRVPLYVIYFILGIIAFKMRWFDERRGYHPFFWLILAVVSTIANSYLVVNYLEDLPKSWLLEWLHALFDNVSCLSLIFTFLNIFAAFFDETRRFWKAISTNSYAVYIIHFDIFLLILWVLEKTSLPDIWQFAIGGVGAYLIALAISELIFKRIPFTNRILYKG